MAACYALDGKPGPFNGAVFFQGINSIMATGGVIPAAAWHVRGNYKLVKTDKPDQKIFHKSVVSNG
jgi:hypothetical protein